MKEWSKHWNRSKQARKQRKYRLKAPLHIRHKFVSANLSKELRKKYKRRNIPVRKGDTVVVLRGQFKKKEGKVSRIDLKKLKIYVENAENIKKDGSKSFYPLDASNLQIKNLNIEDKERIKILERK